jgi:amidase
LDRLRAGERGPLLGIPIAIKDNLDLAGEITSHGSRTERGPAAEDSEVVRRLRAAGAVIVGKTALCELAAWGHFTASDAFGVTRNPWKLERSPPDSETRIISLAAQLERARPWQHQRPPTLE